MPIAAGKACRYQYAQVTLKVLAAADLHSRQAILKSLKNAHLAEKYTRSQTIRTVVEIKIRSVIGQ